MTAKHQKHLTRSIFGLFTFQPSDERLTLLERNLLDLRVEVSHELSSAHMGILRLYGRDKLKPGEKAIAEFIPLSQDLMHKYQDVDMLSVRYGSIVLGVLNAIYAGHSMAFKLEA